MKFIWSACLLFLLGPRLATAQNDPDAKKILDQVSAKAKTYKAVQASFTLRIEDSKGAAQGAKKGTVQMKGDKYHISITGQEIYCDGKNVWTYDKSSNEVTVAKYDPTQTGPQRFFTNFYDKDFLYKLNGRSKVAGKSIAEIEMTPTDKSKNFHKIYVYVDEASHTITSGKMLDAGGNRYIYTISSFNGNAPVSDAAFTFDKAKYPGVEVVNLGE